MIRVTPTVGVNIYDHHPPHHITRFYSWLLERGCKCHWLNPNKPEILSTNSIVKDLHSSLRSSRSLKRTPTEAWWNDLKDLALFSQFRLQGIELIV